MERLLQFQATSEGLIDVTDLEQGLIIVWDYDGGCRLLRGIPAVDFVFHACPRILEGKRFSWPKRAWAFHNLVAHPVMQLLAFVGLGALGVRVHDLSIPRPKGLR